LVAEKEMVSQSQNCGNQLEIVGLDDRKSDCHLFTGLLFLTGWNRGSGSRWQGRRRYLGRRCDTSKFRGVCAVSGPNLGPFNRPDEFATHCCFRRCLSERRLLGTFGRRALSECGR
jgi:hypothetical protein